MKIAFITEAGTSIGYGHLYRCIALAQTFISDRHDVDIFCDGDISNVIIKENLPNTSVFDVSEFNTTILNYALVIIDVYKNSWSNYQQLTQILSIITVSVIDYAFKEYAIPTDYIFQIGYQEYGFKETINQNENKKISKIYSGNDFFIFREEFKNTREFEVRENATRILISMGGSDPCKLTEYVSESLIDIKTHLKITIILGAEINEERLSNINSLFSNSVHEIQIFQNVNNITQLMIENDFSIINGGNTRFELAAIGIPFISVSINAKQSEISDSLQRAGIGYNLGVFSELSKTEINKSIIDFISDYKLRKCMSLTMKKTIKYNTKVMEVLLSNELFVSKY